MAEIDDRVYRALFASVHQLRGRHVRVGVLEGANAGIAAIHEYGAPRAGIPARPFLRQTFERAHAELIALQTRVYRAVLGKRMDGVTALGLIGAWAAGQVKETITSHGEFVPLDPATIEAKGSSRPLVDTGQLVGSITYEIVNR